VDERRGLQKKKKICGWEKRFTETILLFCAMMFK
jgi:hypothetical protein